MYLEVNGRILSRSEIKNHVLTYKKSIKTNRKGRYYKILDLVPRDKYGLDYGCGWGAFTTLVAEKNNKIVGLDLSENEINICKNVWAEISNVDFTNAPIESLPKKEFDFVISNQVIEHTHNPGTYLNEINRVLRMEGNLIISLPNIMNPRFFATLFSRQFENLLVKENNRILMEYRKSRDHIQGWDPVHFSRLVGSAGFRVDRYLPLEGVPLPAFVRKLKLPLNVYLGGRLKNYCYTMAFKLTKVADSDIQGND